MSNDDVVKRLLDSYVNDVMEITLPSGDKCKIMGYISAGALHKYGAAIKKGETSNSAFYNLLCELALDENKIKEELLLLQEQEIISLGHQLLERDEYLIDIYNSINEEKDFFERFKKTWETYNQKQAKAIERILPLNSALSKGVRTHLELGRMAERSTMANLARMENLGNMYRLFNSPVTTRAIELARRAEMFRGNLVVQNLTQLAQAAQLTGSHLSSSRLNILETFSMAQEIANRNNWGNLTYLIGRYDLFPHRQIFTEITSSYTNLVKSIPNTDVFKFAPEILDLSTVEYFNDANLTESLHSEELDEQDELIEVKREQYLTTEGALIPLLERFNRDLATMWQGALHAIDDVSNPERARHFAISARELLTRLLHMLAPDEDVKDWRQSPDLFVNGRPTRRARLLYISSNINHAPLQKYIEADTKGIIGLYDDLSSKTHGTNNNITQQQIDAIKLKVQHYIFYLLSIREYNNKIQ